MRGNKNFDAQQFDTDFEDEIPDSIEKTLMNNGRKDYEAITQPYKKKFVSSAVGNKAFAA
jgi:hypothetical protein